MTRRSLLILLLIGIILASCTPSGEGQPTPDVNATIGAAAGTLAAALFQTQTALAPAATNTPVATVTSLSTSTALTLSTATTFIQQPVYVAPSVTPTGPTSTPISSSLGVGCNNLRLINSWTEPDSPLNAEQQFTQFWQVENNGTCDWLYVFEIVFASGDRTGDASSVRFGKKIEPGKWTTLSVSLRAPKNTGTYKSSWRMTDGAGSSFGSVLPVSVTVGGPTKTPKPDTAATNAAAAQQTIDAAVAATLTKAALCAQNPTPEANPPCPTSPP
jgi:hypothetical protein